MSNLYKWGQDLVAVLRDNGDNAFVKDVNTGRTDNVPWAALRKQIRRKTRRKPPKPFFPNPNPCPTCQTPSFMPGIECPGCGFKEWLEAQ